MEPIDAAIRQILSIPSRPPDPAERQHRARWIAHLFAAYGDRDPERGQRYLEATTEIPLTFLAASVRVIERSRVYPSLPTVGELWTTARRVARMDRPQYRAGQYVPAPREWPPEGCRHGVHVGEVEALPVAMLRLGGNDRRKLEE